MTAVSFTIQDSKNWDFLLAKLNMLAGGSGLPGGASGQIQYNSSGVFGGFTVSGDATLVPSTGVLTLATVNANVGSFGDGTHVATFTVNAKGLTTAAASVAIPTFTSSTVGFVPASGGGTTNYLRADGTFAAPPGSGGTPGGSSGQLQYNNGGAFGGIPTINGDGTINVSTGALAITKTGGVAFGYFATGTDAANLSGTVPLARIGGVVTAATTAPAAPAAGQLWWVSDDTSASVGRAKFYYTDANSSQWVDLTPALPGPTGPQGPAGPTGGTSAVDFALHALCGGI